MQSPTPKVGIIFLTYPTKHWERDINRAMASFEHLSYPKEQLELICVEPERTTPRIKDWFEKTWMPKSGNALPRIHYVFNPGEQGFTTNNNVGVQKARELGCDYIHLINEDTDVDPDCVTEAVAVAESDIRIGAVQSLILLGEERDKINSTGNSYHFLGFGYSNGYREARPTGNEQPHEIGYASGAAVLVRVAALHNEQLFDEKLYMYHEDTDLSLRLRMRGYKVVVAPKSVIWHYYEFGKNRISYYWMERNRYVLVFTYYRLWTLFLLFPMILVMDLAIALFSIKGGWADMKFKVYRDLLSPSFWNWIRLRRKSIKRIRRMGDKEFLKAAVADIRFQEAHVRNPVLEYIGNPLMKGYWAVVRHLLY